MERSVLVRRTAPVAVFVAVLGGLIALNARGGSGTRTPKHLTPIPVAAGGRAEAAGGAPRDAASTATAPYYGTGETVIPDALLAGLPTEVPVVEVMAGDTTTARIAALAKALGVSGEVRRDDEGWVVGTAERALRVVDGPGTPWYLGPDKVAVSRGGVGIATAEPNVAAEEPKPTGGDTPVTNEPAPSCGPDTACSDPQPADCPPPPDGAEPACVPPTPLPEPSKPPQPSDAEARAAAQPVFVAVGLTGATITLNDGWDGKEVVAAPVVAGLPTVGLETRVTVKDGGDVLYANGMLAATKTKDLYPLLAPRAALDRGGAWGGTRMLGGIAADLPLVCPTGEPCPTPVPRTVTKLRLGLMFLASYDTNQNAFLAPAWLLTFEGPWEEPVLALPDAYLATPPPTTDQPGKPGVEPTADPGVVDGGSGSTGSSGSGGAATTVSGAPE
jgi:hypothetical protein